MNNYILSIDGFEVQVSAKDSRHAEDCAWQQWPKAKSIRVIDGGEKAICKLHASTKVQKGEGMKYQPDTFKQGKLSTNRFKN